METINLKEVVRGLLVQPLPMTHPRGGWSGISTSIFFKNSINSLAQVENWDRVSAGAGPSVNLPLRREGITEYPRQGKNKGF